MTEEDAKAEFTELVRQAEEFHGKPVSKVWQDIIWETFYASQLELAEGATKD